MSDELGALRPVARTSDIDLQRREEMTRGLGLLMQRGTVEQIRAAGVRLAPRGEIGVPDALVMCAWEPFDLPTGYVQLWFASGFTCGVGPDGSVSS